MNTNGVQITGLQEQTDEEFLKDQSSKRCCLCCMNDEVNFYDKSSRLGAIAGSRWFGILGSTITGFFLVWEGVKVDYNDASSMSDAAVHFQLLHLTFLAFFVLEAVVRFSALRTKRDILKCPALIWDIFLAVLLILPFLGGGRGVSALSILRILKFLQLSRGARLFQTNIQAKEAQELSPVNSETNFRLMLIGCLKKVPSFILFSICLQYIFSIMCVTSSKTSDHQAIEVQEKYFATVPIGMQSLAIHGCLLRDVSGFVDALLQSALHLTFCFYLIFLVGWYVLLISTVVSMCRQKSSNADGKKEHEVDSEPMSKVSH